MSKRFIYELHGACFRDNGVKLSTKEVLDLLNNLYDDKNDLINALFKANEENEQLKQTIREAYETERTQIGKNVLKQLLEAIQ